ncbi:MAG TPA: carboxypeptidase-like regulatory domain-containing protein [Anaerolineales bacterium]|nr:carboxypeptidase-like regulatory domain-containing protein [Anaerolineales bacterium]
MLKRMMIPVVLLLFTCSACTQGQPINPTHTPSSGIMGSVTEGPMCPGPVQIGNNPCPDQAYQATIIVLDSDGHKLTQVQTDTNGFFTLPLDPGKYTLHPESGEPFPIAGDQSVVVTEGQYLQVTIQYDTGMR